MPVFLVQNTLVARPYSLRVRLARPTANGLRLRCEARGEGAVLFGSDVARGFSVESFRQVGARRIERKEHSFCALHPPPGRVRSAALYRLRRGRGRVRISPEQFSASAEGFGG